MLVRQIVDPGLSQYAYLIGCQASGDALIVDPERDIDRYIALAAAEGLRIVAVAETHIHADFLSGAREFAAADPNIRIYVSGEGGPDWTHQWPTAHMAVARLRDGNHFRIGRVDVRAWHTPGHTPEHLSFVVTDQAATNEPVAVLSGDFVFAGDLGRPDLLETAAGIRGTIEPAAKRLYQSALAFLALPDYLQVWPGHGAGSACGKALGAVPWTTVGYERRTSPALAAAKQGERAFVDFIVSGQPEPPVYFARMKHLNTIGPALWGQPVAPPRLDAPALVAAVERGAQVVDTRLDRAAFLRSHLTGSFLAPLDHSFPTIAGSFLDPEQPIVLLADEAGITPATRQLARIGFDRVEGWAPVETLDDERVPRHLVVATESIPFARLEQGQNLTARVLDVRSASEHAVRHLPLAINIAHTRLQAESRRLDQRVPLLVHCASGVRAAAAGAFLAHHGFTVIHVDGGFESSPSSAVDSRAHELTR